MNKSTVTIKGRLTADPKLQYGKNNSAYTYFTIAANRSTKTDKGWETENEGFYDFVAFGQQAERIAQRLQKGQAVIATGTMRQETYKTRNGEERTKIAFQTDEIGLNVWTKTWPDGTETAASIAANPITEADTLSDDIPF